MRSELKKSLSNKKTLLILSFICVIIGAFACLLGEFVLPVLIGVLSALYLFDSKSGRVFSLAVSFVLLAINAAALVLGISVSFFSLSAIIISLIISNAFEKDHSKADAAYVSTIICAALSVVGSLLFAMIEMDSYTIDAAISYYKEMFDAIRVIFVDAMLEAYAIYNINVKEEVILAVYDRQISMMISYMIIGGFINVGIGMKIFGAIVSYCAESKDYIKSWRFKTTTVYAYFYVILAIISVFLNSTDTVFAISVLNLYNIFMIVFAYVGFTSLLEILRKRMKPGVSLLILCGATVVFSTFAIQLLAAIGVLFGVKSSRIAPPTEQ